MICATILGLMAALPSPVVRGHSHNDYAQARPLFGALEAGMCSIEADVFLIDGELRVGHSQEEAQKNKTLGEMYLRPLAALPKVGGRLGQGWPEVTLLVDIKAQGELVYPVLLKQVSAYPETFSTDRTVRAVRVVVSGDRPVDSILNAKEGWLALDGRRENLGQGISPRRMPLVSESWSWVGYNKNIELPAENWDRAKGFAESVAKDARKCRFWGVPDRPDYWSLMDRLGVDWLNTDRPDALRKWSLKGG